MPGSESRVVFPVIPVDDVTFHEGTGVKGSAKGICKMHAVKTAIHPALDNRILTFVTFGTRKKRCMNFSKGAIILYHTRQTLIRLVPATCNLAGAPTQCNLSKSATPHLQKRRHVAG
jgi:hypothetical protein